MEIQFVSNSKNFTVSPKSINLSLPGVNENLLPIISDTTATLIYEKELFDYFVFTNEEIIATVKDGEKTLFTGTLQKNLSWKDMGEPYPIDTFEISISNKLHKLEVPAEKDFYYKDATLEQILSDVCSTVGVEIDASSSGLSETIPFFLVQKGQKLSEAIFALLAEYCFVATFTNLGLLKTQKINLDAEKIEIDAAQIYGHPTVKKNKKEYDKIKLNYGIAIKKEKEQLYFAGNDLDESNQIVPITVRPGQYYPYESDPIQEEREGQIFQSFEQGFAESYTTYAGETRYRRNSSAKLIYSENHFVVEDWSGSLKIDRTEFTPVNASVRLYNEGSSDASLYQLAIRADAYYRQEAFLEAGSGKKEFEQQTKNIYTAEQAEKYASLLSQINTGIRYNLSIEVADYYEPLTCCNVHLGSSEFSVDGIILSASYDTEKETYTYSIVSVSEAKLIENKYKDYSQIQNGNSNIVSTIIQTQNNTIPRDVRNAIIIATETGLRFEHEENEQKYFSRLIAEISKEPELWEPIELTGTYYYFNRNKDGFPEKEQLNSWKVRIKTQNVYNKQSENWVEYNISTGNYGSWIPANMTVATPTATRDGFVINWVNNRTTYGSSYYYVSVFNGEQEIKSEKLYNQTYQYVFDRNKDGYPEKEDFPETKNLNNYYVVIEHCNEAYPSDFGTKSPSTKLNLDTYGTWRFRAFSTDNIQIDVRDRTVALTATTPLYPDLEYYGNTKFKIKIKRIGSVAQREDFPKVEQDAVWSKPNLFGEPWKNELDYRTNSNEAFVFDGNFIQTLPLLGQSTKNAVDTIYQYQIQPFNEVMEGSAVVIPATALCSSLRDIVIANQNFKNLYVGTISAINANIGLINQGGFGNFTELSSNYWALSQLFPEETGLNRVIHEGEFRVGDSNSYIKVSFDDRGSAILDFKTDTFTVTSVSTEFSKELVITENSRALERTRITPSGTFFEARKSPTQPWEVVAKMDVTGVLTPTYMAKNQIVIGNADQSQIRAMQHDIGRPYLSPNAKVWHFDENENSQNGTEDGLTISGVERKLVGSEDNTQLMNFTPAILREAPFTTLSKSLYGLFQLAYNLSEVQEFTVDFWQQYIYNEKQLLFQIGSNADKIILQVKPAEPVYCVSGLAEWQDANENKVYTSTRNPLPGSYVYDTPEQAEAETSSDTTIDDVARSPDGDVSSFVVGTTLYTFVAGDPDYNWEVFAPQELWSPENIIYNIAAEGDTDLTHSNATQEERISLLDKGFKFVAGEWYHIGIVFTAEKINVLLNTTVFEFNRYGTAINDVEILISSQQNSALVDELYIDTVAEDTEEFKTSTEKRIPWASLDKDIDWFIFDAKDPAKIKSNILEEFKRQLLDSDEFKNAVKNIN